MTARNPHLLRFVWTLGMIALLTTAVFTPTVGIWIQHHHRMARQCQLRDRRMKIPFVQIVLEASDVEQYLLKEKNELAYGGLLYDVHSIQHIGQRFIFKAVPDIKDTRLRAMLIAGKVISSSAPEPQHHFSPTVYLAPMLLLLYPNLALTVRQSAFFEKKGALMTGFGQIDSPPPDQTGSEC